MADVGMVIRIAANLAELKKNLAEGKNLIDVTTSGMKKLAASLDGNKLIQHAHNIVGAVREIGGVTKLTEAEKARLNVTLTKAIEKYKALGKEAPTAMRELEQATRQVEQPTNVLTTKAIALGSAIGSAIGNVAVNAAMRFGQEMLTAASNGVQLASLVTSFDRLAAGIGETGDAMLAMTRGATKGLISDLSIMQSANKAMLLGLPVTSAEMAKLAQTAVVLGKAMGQDATKSLDDLITALGRSSPMILDNLGLTVKVGEANEQYAASLGKSASQLTEAEKKLAFYRAAMEAAEAKTAQLGGVQLTLSDHVSRLTTGLGNIVTGFARQLAQAPAVEGFFSRLADYVNRAAMEMDDLAEATRRVREDSKAFGGPLGAFKDAPSVARGRIEELLRQIALERARAAALSNRPGLPTTSPFAVPALEGAMETYLDFVADKLTKAPEAAIKAAEKASEQTKKLIEDMREFGEQQFRSLMAVSGAVMPGGLPRILQQENALGVVSPGMLFGPGGGLSQITPGGLPDALKLENLLGPLAPAKSGGFLSGLTGGFKSMLQGLTGGQGFGGFMSNIGGGIAQGFGQLLSGGVTSLISGGLGLAVKGLGKLFGFGPSDREKTEQLRKQWLEQIGGMEKFRAAAERAGVSVDKVFSARKPKDFEAAVKAATSAIQMAEEKQQRLNEVAQRYGLTIDQYGAKFRRQRLNEQAQALLEDYRDLLEITENVAVANEKIAPELNRYLLTAARLGVEVPAAMRPIIQSLIDQGLLLDEAGNKITDIQQLGLTFGQTLTEGFRSVVDAIKALTDAILGIPKQVDIHVGYTADPFPTPGPGGDVPQLHRGGRVRKAHNGWLVYPGGLASDEVPIIAQTGEGVLSRKGMAAFDALNQGRVPGLDLGAVVDELRALRRDGATQRAEMVRLLETIPIAARDQVMLARGRSA